MAEFGEPLSDRELDVLQELAAGASNKSIADDLSISPYTVKTHLRNIFTKLGVSTRTEAISVAMQRGLLARPATVVAPMTEKPGAALTMVDPRATTLLVAGDGELALEPTATQDAPPLPAPRATLRRWAAGGLIAALVVALVVIALLLRQQQNGALAVGTVAPFEEQPIGETRWLASRPLPEARAGTARAVGLDIYLLGGATESGVTGDVHIFNTQERAWRRAAEKPTPVADATAVELFGEIYVPGGVREDGRPTDVVEAYSPSQNAWRRLAPLPRPIAGGLTVADGGFLYVFGGWDGAEYLDSAFVYDPGNDSWRPLAEMPEPRAFAAGDALMGRLYVTGGSDGQSAQSSCFVYSPPADEWSDCPDLLEPRAAAGATVLLNKLYVLGGAASDAGHGEVYDPNTGTWTVLNMPPGTATRANAGVSRVENRIYAMGGQDGVDLSDATLVYSPFVYQTYIPAAPSGPDR